jgi:ribosomal protein S18 acetylase RimI-like enzyme
MYVLRPIRPDDRDALARFHGRLSTETRYRRYHATKGKLSERELTYLTCVDGRDHVAYVAVRDGELVAVARVASDGGHGELAMVVADDSRRRGLAVSVCEAAVAAYQAQHPGRLVIAFIQPDNRAAVRLVRDRLGALLGGHADGILRFELLPPGVAALQPQAA